LTKSLIPPLLEANPVTDDMLAPPPDKGRFALNTMSTGETQFHNLEKDTSCGDFPLGQWVKLKVTQSLLPLEDLFVGISEHDVPKLMEETKLDQALPPPTVVFENPTSDAGLTRQAFYGLGSQLVTTVSPKDDQDAPDGAVFRVDFRVLTQFEVRPGFANYGTCAYFDRDQQPLAIWHNVHQLVTPRDQGGYRWEVAKFAWRVDLVTYVTAVNHLYNLHFTVAAQMLRASREALSKDHALKRALEPFLMRTALINNKAGTALLPEQSILHHITAFTWDSLCQVAAATYQKGNEWQGLETTIDNMAPEMKELIQAGKIPYYQDGLDLYHCFKKYFAAYVPETDEQVLQDADIVELWKLLGDYSGANQVGYLQTLTRASLLEALATFAWRVTAGHDQVGSIREHMDTPLHGGFRSQHNAVQVDKQSYLGGMLLLAMTSLKTPPLLSAFDKYWKSDLERNTWTQLQTELKALSATIDQRNQTRPYVFEAANPKVLECAVSV